MTTRRTRIAKLKQFIENNPILWNNVIHRRQILESFAVKWGLRTQTVVDYVKQLDAVRYSRKTQQEKIRIPMENEGGVSND